jgi:hypothetical protein
MSEIDAYTKLLLHCDGADASTTFTDASPSARGNATVVGTAQVDTAQKKFGTGSLLLDGNSDGITYADSADWTFGTDNWTIDFWVRFASTSGVQSFLIQRADVNNYLYFRKESDNKLMMIDVVGSSNRMYYITTSAPTINTNTWYHIAYVRNGAGGLIFLDGTSLSLTENTAMGTMADISAIVSIGYMAATSENFVNGWIDEFRVSKGIARWTANFTPEKRAYGEDAPKGGIGFGNPMIF